MFPVVNLGQAGRMLPPQARTGSAGQRWWSHHIANTRAYAEAVMAGDTGGAVKAVGELWKAVLDWQKLTGSPVAGILMAEHTALAKMLADGFAEKRGDAWTSSATSALIKNVETQSKLFPRDPEGFVALFGPHTELAGAYITDIANDDTDALNGHWAQALQNGADLAAWTDHTFGPGAR